MEMSKFTISQEAYEVLDKMNIKDRNVLIEEMIPKSIRLGYGLYGFGITKNEGRPFVWYNHGDSCD